MLQDAILQSFGLFVGFFITFSIALYLLRRDRSYLANLTLSMAYFSLSLTIFLNIFYLLFIFEFDISLLLIRLTQLFAIVFGLFLYATINYIRFGNEGFKRPQYLAINGFSLLMILGVLLYDGITITIQNGVYIVTWDIFYLIMAGTPIFIVGTTIVVYFLHLYPEIKEDPFLRRQVRLSIAAYSIITIAYFFSRLPFYVLGILPELADFLLLMTNIALIMVLIVAILIAYIFLQKRPNTP